MIGTSRRMILLAGKQGESFRRFKVMREVQMPLADFKQPGYIIKTSVRPIDDGECNGNHPRNDGQTISKLSELS